MEETEGKSLKLKLLYYARLLLALLVLCYPLIRDFATNGGFLFRPGVSLFGLACMLGVFLCHKAYCCPVCKKSLGTKLLKRCPHCDTPLER